MFHVSDAELVLRDECIRCRMFVLSLEYFQIINESYNRNHWKQDASIHIAATVS